MALRNAFADLATEPTLAAILTELGQSKRTQLDYAARTDAQPVYLGTATVGAATSAAVWTVSKFRYESAAADARLMEIDQRDDVAWDNRATPTPAWEF